MKRIFKTMHRDNKGFTLVELLIVFTLLAVLAAIVLPNVTGMIGFGQTQGAAAELDIVQTALDSMMAKEGLASVTATTATATMSAFPTGNPLYPNYLRVETTKGTYSNGTSGNVTQVTTGY
ncbi:MAG: type II secretion system protein [Chloroflexota bacterium]|nr:type II secretion system protein [Chloroflexota bacterium]